MVSLSNHGKALQPVDHGDEDVLDAAVAEIVHHLEPELRALGLLDPQAENLLLALRGERQNDVHCLVPHQPVIPDLDPQRVEEHHRVDRVERPVLPGGHLVEHRVGHPRDEIGRHLDLIELAQMPLDLPHRQATRVQRDHLVIKPVEPRLAFRHDLQLESCVPVARHIDGHRTVFGQHRLRVIAVARIPRPAARRIALLVAEMMRQLGAERQFQQGLLQLLE